MFKYYKVGLPLSFGRCNSNRNRHEKREKKGKRREGEKEGVGRWRRVQAWAGEQEGEEETVGDSVLYNTVSF